MPPFMLKRERSKERAEGRKRKKMKEERKGREEKGREGRRTLFNKVIHSLGDLSG